MGSKARGLEEWERRNNMTGEGTGQDRGWKRGQERGQDREGQLTVNY